MSIIKIPSKNFFHFFIVLLASATGFASAADLRVMKQGLGSGTVISTTPGINCGVDCDQSYASPTLVTLTASPASAFVEWQGDCTGSGSCMVNMNSDRSVRAVFDLPVTIPELTDFSPEGIQDYLDMYPFVDSVPKFIAALPAEFKQNWILMSRSESLQTGIAAMPRILMPSADTRFVFSLGLSESNSYPAAHPNAIEYMQWDAGQKNFRFHEIILAPIPAMDPDMDGVGAIPARSRSVTEDDIKCSRCHSTRNVENHTGTPGTSGITPGTIKVKNKPNWDPYDSWGGMMPFNRDRIYKGSVEAAAFRKMMNLWTWRDNEFVRAIIEQLELQPPGIPINDEIIRTVGGANDGHINFSFDTGTVSIEPDPDGTSTIATNYNFDNTASGDETDVSRNGSFVVLHHSISPTSSEGRGVQLFDTLGGFDGNLNQLRIADEVASHRWATGNVYVDPRALAFAISRDCFQINDSANTVTSSPAHTVNLSFFNARNGMTINELVADTRARVESVPRRKADIQKVALDRTGDLYTATGSPENGLIQEYGAFTSASTDTSLERIRQEIFRRQPSGAEEDNTLMGGIYVDREDYDYNIRRIALYRYFLEPLGISVDKWSLGTRGRSRTYAFADVFSGYYTPVFQDEWSDSLGLSSGASCSSIIPLVNSSMATLPPVGDIPTYTDIQRIFNKSCIECHGGLDYPPYQNYGTFVNLSEDEAPPPGDDALDRSHSLASALVTTNPATSYLYSLVTNSSEDCPLPGMMPCGGPSLSKTDTETIRRWIVGSAPNTRGDPHIRTVDGTHYDFQAAGEFVLLKGTGLEIQARHTAVETTRPVGPNGHTGLTSCVSLNSAAAVKIGPHRITYQPGLDGKDGGLELRIDGKQADLTGEGVFLSGGGRVIQTSVADGIQIEAPGGTTVTITPNWWNAYQVWYMNIDVRNARASMGLMGKIAGNNWLPAMPDGSWLGPRPASLLQRYDVLYKKFGDAWRVTDKSSLFDYAPGTSTKTFTVPSWPLGESPKVCEIPPDEGGSGQEPVKGMPLDKAKQICAAVVDKHSRENCIQDVGVTGEAGFAKVYLASEKFERNDKPEPPELIYPKAYDEQRSTVEFGWKSTADKEGEPLRYWLCLWPNTEKQTFRHCKVVAEKQYGDKPVKMGYEAGRLKVGKSYFWKVIVEDQQNGTTESETRRFKVVK